MPHRLIPTGECWYGCGKEAGRGFFFLPGYGKVAESAVLLIEYGGVPEFLTRHGYAPGGKNPRKALEAWRSRGKARRSKAKQEPKQRVVRETNEYTRQ
jgi:hypothetical protein